MLCIFIYLSGMLSFVRKNKTVLVYGVAMAGLLILLKALELRFVIYDHAFEAYVGAIAVLFTGLGIWLASRLSRPKLHTVVVERTVPAAGPFVLDETELERLGISRRELEVLGGMAEGLSNQQIADKLFVSLNTIKTHSSRLFEKLDVQRRTQAVDKAKRIGIIP